MMVTRLILFASWLTCFSTWLHGVEQEQLVFFESKIRPLLAAECYDCHGADTAKAGLRMDHVQHILNGGDSGPAVVPGKPGESLLVEAISRTNAEFAMPPKKELSADQVALLKQWVAMGAPWPEDKEMSVAARDENGFTPEDKAWWAVQPLAKVVVPESGQGWAKNEIDQFIHARLTASGLEPSRPAGATELVRRIYFDLHGLPPTVEQADDFARDFQASPDQAVAELVDELLASPRYGERWGQHWLDLVRYAESDGYRQDAYRPSAYHYRDYVVKSFNQDKPYDRFVREQLAGDELDPDNPEVVIGSAFLRHGVYEYNQRGAKMHWDLIVNEMTSVTGEVFLGLSVGCAQCHDHKFDPILQKDYFALQSFLATTYWPTDRVLATPEQIQEYEQKLKVWEDATASVREEIEQLVGDDDERRRLHAFSMFPADVQEHLMKPEAEKNAYDKQLTELAIRQVPGRNMKRKFAKDAEKLARYEALEAKLKEFDKIKPAPLPNAFISTDIATNPVNPVLKNRRGEQEITPAFLTLLGQEAPEIKPTATTTGRRTALANWITDPSNPLTARVMMNRVWSYHFGTGLAASPNDFGNLGEKPSHPELLDWLATSFVARGWTIKQFHRDIITSATYRQTSRREPGELETRVDNANRLLWRFPPQRLKAEQLRDALLATSGELNMEEGGPAVGGDSLRRSIYVRKVRNTPDAFLNQFDSPQGFISSSDRVNTTTPTQSLLLINGEWVLKRAEKLARALLSEPAAQPEDMVQMAFMRTYGRAATEEEVQASLNFLDTQSALVGAPKPAEGKFAGETGVRPVSQVFGQVKSPALALGDRALWLQPGSQFERLEYQGAALPASDFTIEGVAVLESIPHNAEVNSLVTRWNGNQKTSGFSLGVTSEASGYRPRNLIMQLIGDVAQGSQKYEVVASNLHVPLKTPFYFAASVVARPTDANKTKGLVTFYLKNLDQADAPLQVSQVPHQIVGGLNRDIVKTLIGGRDEKGHLWDGQLARLTISEGALEASQLLIHGNQKPIKRLLDWRFHGEPGEQPALHSAWYRPGSEETSGHDIQQLGALTDLCHALMTSNEFIYLN